MDWKHLAKAALFAALLIGVSIAVVTAFMASVFYFGPIAAFVAGGMIIFAGLTLIIYTDSL